MQRQRLLSQGCHTSCSSLVIVSAAYIVLQKASLIAATLHFRASLHSASLHFISPPFLSAFRSPPAAILGSPAHRPRLRGCHAFCKKEKAKVPPAPCCKQ